MRLAEFKMRLLVFLARRLLRWASALRIAQADEQSPELNAARVSAPDSVTRSRAEGLRNTDPPEHWTRLVTKDPPQSWVNLLREKAPELLTEFEDDVPAEFFWETLRSADAEASQLRETNSQPAAQATLETVDSRRPRVNRMNYPVNAEANAWLNRLRFASPRVAENETTYVSHHEGRNAPDDDAGPAPVHHAKPRYGFLPFVRTYVRSRETTGKTPANHAKPRHRFLSFVGSYVRSRETTQERPAIHQTIRSHGLAPGLDAIKANQTRSARHLAGFDLSTPTRPSHLSDRTALDALHSPAENQTRMNRRRTSPAPVPPAPPPAYSNSSSRLRFFSDRSHRQHGSRLAITPTKPHKPSSPKWEEQQFARPMRHMHSGLDLKRVHPSGQRISDSAFVAQSDHSAMDNQANYVEPIFSRTFAAEPEQRTERSEFPQMPADPEVFEGRRRDWPTLPPVPTFDFSDEVLMRDSEREGLRRLDEEQRGKPWNA